MNDEAETVQIDITHPEEFLGHEFYLMISRTGVHEEIAARVEAHRGRLSAALRTARGIVDRVRGTERDDPSNYDGAMIEVAERQPSGLSGYLWPEFNQATLEDGTRVGSTILAPEIYRDYIFVPTQAQSMNGNGYRMSGMARPYRLHTNSLGDLEQKVELHFDNVPERKTKDASVLCF